MTHVKIMDAMEVMWNKTEGKTRLMGLVRPWMMNSSIHIHRHNAQVLVEWMHTDVYFFHEALGSIRKA
jgi:hypothetical protein